MANEKHLEILLRGVQAWNEWRIKDTVTKPELNGADLTLVNLAGANLSKADLRNAGLKFEDLSVVDFGCEFLIDLSGADLSHADLRRADLRNGVFNCANFESADLRAADLRNADLRFANLRDANLIGTTLDNADLSGSQMSSARCGYTTFGRNDLSNIDGLSAVRHVSPSTIGLDTIYRSGGRIPDSFLRGAGVPEDFLTYMKSLTAAALDFYSVFISYSTNDRVFAEGLHADLQVRGVRCWFAPEDLKIGDRIRSRIDESIRIHDKLLLVLSDSAIRSAWVEKEVEAAFERERREDRTVLFPIRLDDAVIETNEAWAADIRRTRHIGDFTGWEQHPRYAKAFERLLHDLKAQRGEKAADTGD